MRRVLPCLTEPRNSPAPTRVVPSLQPCLPPCLFLVLSPRHLCTLHQHPFFLSPYHHGTHSNHDPATPTRRLALRHSIRVVRPRPSPVSAPLAPYPQPRCESVQLTTYSTCTPLQRVASLNASPPSFLRTISVARRLSESPRLPAVPATPYSKRLRALLAHLLPPVLLPQARQTLPRLSPSERYGACWRPYYPTHVRISHTQGKKDWPACCAARTSHGRKQTSLEDDPVTCRFARNGL